MPKLSTDFLILIVGLFICTILAALLMPSTAGPREDTNRVHCFNNLHQIAIALHNYHDDYHTFPPAYVTDAHGRRMHSWRVLILPYLDQQALYARYDFAQPWDGPDNAQLAEEFQIPEVYQCRLEARERGLPPHDTSYLAIVGPHTCWLGAEPLSFDQITDPASDTLMLVESAGSGIHWMEPRDLNIDEMAMTISADSGQGISSAHERFAIVVFADGHTDILPENIDAGTLQRLIEREDGEDAPDF